MLVHQNLAITSISLHTCTLQAKQAHVDFRAVGCYDKRISKKELHITLYYMQCECARFFQTRISIQNILHNLKSYTFSRFE